MILFYFRSLLFFFLGSKEGAFFPQDGNGNGVSDDANKEGHELVQYTEHRSSVLKVAGSRPCAGHCGL